MIHSQFNWCWYHIPSIAYVRGGRNLVSFGSCSWKCHPKCQNNCDSFTKFDTQSQSVFKILTERQLSRPDEDGMPINNLYTICRERFLVNIQVTPNSHLTEFKDHELVKTENQKAF